jgi:hypothetical protein
MVRAVSERRAFRHRAIAWVTAYALVLQAVLAPIVALAAAAPDARGSAAFEICLDHALAATDFDQVPGLPQQHDEACKHCIACGLDASLPPDHVITRTVAEAVSDVGWLAVAQPDPDGPLLSGRSARGPPAGRMMLP